ncbi:hypothetical protein MMC25_004773 [Agyrium rufum]|nr:hypothetical protein [Agyrium rufum]
MSGRSARVRKERHHQASEHQTQETRDIEMATTSHEPSASFFVPSLQVYLPALESSNSTMGPSPLITTPILGSRASTVSISEKSEMRHHFDGFSDSIRKKLTITAKKKGPSLPESHLIGPMPRLYGASNVLERTSKAPLVAGSTPATAVPSLTIKEDYLSRVWIFTGAKKPTLGWGYSFDHNTPMLWFQDGDVAVFMNIGVDMKGLVMRLDSEIIDSAGSLGFIEQLRSNRVPDGIRELLPMHSPSNSQSKMSEEVSPTMTSISWATAASSNTDPDMPEIKPLQLLRRPSQRSPTNGITYHVGMPFPFEITNSNLDDLHRWNVTTRNLLAMIYGADTIVGETLYGSLLAVLERVRAHPRYLCDKIPPWEWIARYVIQKEFHDVRNNPIRAASFLSFCENEGMEWREGYVEAFAHCAGMFVTGKLNPGLPEWRLIQPHSQLALVDAKIDLEARLMKAQYYLETFDFSEMWESEHIPSKTAIAAVERFRLFLCKHYGTVFAPWPASRQKIWLTRSITKRLDNDFSALYEFLVDRKVALSDVTGDQDWKFASLSVQQGGAVFLPESQDVPLRQMFLAFDTKHKLDHIPRPYPLLPEPVPVRSKARRLFASKTQHTNNDDVLRATRKNGYSTANNMVLHGNNYIHSDLVTKFAFFEQFDMIDNIDPCEARMARWVLLYGVLQILSTISADNPHIQFKKDVDYHLGCQLKACVPWQPDKPRENQAGQQLSHCWTTVAKWSDPVRRTQKSTSQSASSELHNPQNVITLDTRETSIKGRLEETSVSEKEDISEISSCDGTCINELTDAATIPLIPQSSNKAQISSYQACNGTLNSKTLPTRTPIDLERRPFRPGLPTPLPIWTDAAEQDLAEEEYTLSQIRHHQASLTDEEDDGEDLLYTDEMYIENRSGYPEVTSQRFPYRISTGSSSQQTTSSGHIAQGPTAMTGGRYWDAISYGNRSSATTSGVGSDRPTSDTLGVWHRNVGHTRLSEMSTNESFIPAPAFIARRRLEAIQQGETDIVETMVQGESESSA